MTRKYTRDNKGKFATTGATARGGRLKTASGGKREGQTMKAKGQAGVVGKPAGLKPESVKPMVAAVQTATTPRAVKSK